jgi:hypothetical protein
MQQVIDTLQQNAGALAAIAAVLALLALVVAWRAARRAAQGSAGLAPSTTSIEDPALDQIISAQMQRLDGLQKDIQGVATRTRGLEASGRHAFQRAGLVRFNPFREDTGGNLSFALALLDADDNGIVLSSLHSRQNTRVYIKAITAGHSDQALSEEETEALRQAHSSGNAQA